MTRGKKITLFLMDGVADGRQTCELSNWTGKAYKIPRTQLKDCSERQELKQPGVYFLLGRNDSNVDRPFVYVGEAENIYTRLGQHLTTEEDYWNEVIVFVSKDKNLNKAHAKFLENSFYTLVKEANRYEIKNAGIPTRPALSEPEEAELEEFIEHSLVLVNVLGHRMFEKIAIPSEHSESENCFFLNKGKVKAKGFRTSEGFVVLKGATMNAKVSGHSFAPSIRRKIEIEQKFKNWETTADIEFSSPSSAACFLLGYNVSGPAIWLNSHGQSLKDIEAATV